MEEREKAIQIFLAGVESVKPNNLINRFVSLNQNLLQIEEFSLDLTVIQNIFVVGAGKASAAMARAIEEILGSRIASGHIVTKYGHSVTLKFIEITEAGHPVPDENGIRGTERILSIVQRAGKDDLVICLISGGGSALLADLPVGCSLDDLQVMNTLLLKTGANINELNCLRKHLSMVKGGQLAKSAFPARVVSLILSDVIGDPLDVIASGPTAPDPTTFEDALSIVRKYRIENELPGPILSVLRSGFNKKRPETLKESDEMFFLTKNLIIGTNLLALKAAGAKAETLGYQSRIVTNTLQGEVKNVAKFMMDEIRRVEQELSGEKRCLLFGGEPTVNIGGGGLGGRNQHLALMMAKYLEGHPGITFLSGGTDGSDGPTDAAGAVVDSETAANAINLSMNPDHYLRDFDSYHFFKKEGGIIITGPTQTNVMDLMVVLIGG